MMNAIAPFYLIAYVLLRRTTSCTLRVLLHEIFCQIDNDVADQNSCKFYHSLVYFESSKLVETLYVESAVKISFESIIFLNRIYLLLRISFYTQFCKVFIKIDVYNAIFESRLIKGIISSIFQYFVNNSKTNWKKKNKKILYYLITNNLQNI